jgi:hypothetical protein
LKISEKDEISFVSLLDYNKKIKDDASGSEVAVLYAAGEIVDGEWYSDLAKSAVINSPANYEN